jgi:hypothetical protein
LGVRRLQQREVQIQDRGLDPVAERELVGARQTLRAREKPERHFVRLLHRGKKVGIRRR